MKYKGLPQRLFVFQLKIRAFIDHQSGVAIPVENVGDILNPKVTVEDDKPSSATEEKVFLDDVYEKLVPMKPIFARREQIFVEEIRAERRSRQFSIEKLAVTIPQFLDSNRTALADLSRDSEEHLPKLNATPTIRALYEAADSSRSEYVALLKAHEATQILAKAKLFQVCRLLL